MDNRLGLMCPSSAQEYGQEVEDTAAAPVRCEGDVDCQCVFFGKGVQAVAAGDEGLCVSGLRGGLL